MDNGLIYDSSVKDFLDSNHMRLAQVLADYDDTLTLEFVPRLDRDEEDTKPFRIIQTPRDGRAPYVVRYLSEYEMKNPAQVLEWIWEGDFKKHSPDAIFNRMEARRIAAEVLDIRKQEDDRAEQVDLVANLARGGTDKKHYYRHNGKTFHRG